MENRNWKLKLLGTLSSIEIVFLIFWILVDIFICKIDVSNLDLKKSNPKIEIENEVDGRLPGDDVEASGYAGNWDFENETGIYYLESSMVDYDAQLVFFNLTETERKTIQYIVAGEAKGESMEGKMAVAQCILNSMVKSDWTAEKVRIEYQYSGWDDELEKSNPKAWAEVVEAVSRVFDDGELISDKPILYFYAPKYSSGEWHETLEFSFELSGHRFFYLKEDESADWFLNLEKEV